jgi:hypothetical protein
MDMNGTKVSESIRSIFANNWMKAKKVSIFAVVLVKLSSIPVY